MKGYTLHAINDLKYEEIKYPECPSGWCVIKVKYAGICSSDIPRIFTKGTYFFPTVPGHEFSGIVDSVADDENERLIGKKVGIFPLIPCKKCEQCQNGHYETCENYDYVGSRRNGAFADYVAVPVWNLIELPDSVPLKEAAMMEPLSVALHAMKQVDIKKGDTVGIVGTGMIAFAAGQWAARLGASKVIIFGRDNSKRKIAEAIPGVQFRVLSESDEQFDVVLEAVGSGNSIDKSINLVKTGGRLILMGNPEGDIVLKQNTYWRILRKQLKVFGTWNSSYEKDAKCDWYEVKDALANREIQASLLITHMFDKEHLEEGLNLMKSHKEPYCKVMTLWDGE